MKTIKDLISLIDETFKKDDIKSIPRTRLNRLVLDIYDGLHEIDGSLPDWWERDTTAEAEQITEMPRVYGKHFD